VGDWTLSVQMEDGSWQARLTYYQLFGGGLGTFHTEGLPRPYSLQTNHQVHPASPASDAGSSFRLEPIWTMAEGLLQ
jgi:hypothetical protein